VCLLPEVEKLAAADAAEGTEYLPTLRAYLGAFQDRAAAAEKLGMHKNTVLYRIRRLEELAGVDLSDPACADRMSLGLAFHDLQSVKGGGEA
jgi:DNA-binding PucR family transcriptional regulator